MFMYQKQLQVVGGRGQAEITLVVALGIAGDGFGRGGGRTAPGLLAPEDELARSISRIFLPGMPGLRHQAPV
jgi:hypothetical protein